MIERLLSVDFPEVGYFRAQVPHVTVVRACECGCGTIDFEVDLHNAPPAPAKAWRGDSGPIVEGDRRCWLMLFQRDGRLSELEHVPGYGPRPDELEASEIEPDLQVTDDWFS